MRPFIVGTAGHIDHGKSALVHALTGIDPDRLPEEKKRGITIDLGFAHAKLGDGAQAAFIDVPGHERFVRAMVAGAHGVDVVLLVVALDEGVMPQTREHADICRLLAVPRAVVALTKADLLPNLDPEWPVLVEDDIRKLGAPFEAAAMVRVSARSGEGLDTLKAALVEAARTLDARPTQAPAFLSVDRVFTLKGHGTIATGTLLTGTLQPEALVDLVVPAPRSAALRTDRRVRSLQVHGKAVTKGVAGQRVALNLTADLDELPRGSAIVAAGSGALRQAALLDVELTTVAGVPPIRNRARLTVHLGTAQALATVDLLGRSETTPDEIVVAQLRLDRALPALRDQRFVLRGFRGLKHGGRTVAGGRVLWLDARRRRASDLPLVESLRGEASVAARALVREAAARGVEAARLSLVLGVSTAALAKASGLVEQGGALFTSEALEGGRERLQQLVRERQSISREEARATLSARLHPAAFAWAVERLGPGFIVGETLTVAGLARHPDEARLEGVLSAAGLAPPTAGELGKATGLAPTVVGQLLRSLTKAGRVVRLTDELFVHADAAADFRQRAIEALRAKGALTTLELKELVGASRKFAIPLCEWLDREHVTLRVGEKRVLRGTGVRP
jgi:selenocysteine-specific elongation factor